MQTPMNMEYQNTYARVVQRPGAIDDLGREVLALGCTRVLVVCGGSTRRSDLYERGNKSLGSLVVVACYMFLFPELRRVQRLDGARAPRGE